MDRPNGINDAGLVVGDRGGNNIATTWTESDGYQEVRRLDGTTNCCSSLNDVNSSGDAAGWSFGGSATISWMEWSQATNTKTDLLIPEDRAYASSINDRGDVVGYARGAPWVAYYKPLGGTPVILAQQPGIVNAYAWAINNAGMIVGQHHLGADMGYREHAVVWSTPGGAPTDLGTLGGLDSYAYGVNQVNDVVGSALDAGGVKHAILWTPGGGMVDLGTWPNPCSGTSEAKNVNDLGIIVGTCNGRPVYWTAVQGMRALPLPGGVTQGQPTAINNRNQVVGSYNGFGGALWTIVTPNSPPVASAGGAYVDNEGSALTLRWSASDGDGDALSYSWDFGDGTTGSGTTLPTTHTYVDDGTYTISITAADGKGGTDTKTTTATITNVVPTVGALTVSATPVPLGSVVSVSASFTDPGTADTHTGQIQWDIGAPFTLASVSETNGSGTASASSTTLGAGVYTITLKVTDKDAGVGLSTATSYVVVYDPTGSFVTGGGWILSQSGDCRLSPACQAASGKATFGFVSKYQKGTNVPSGNTEFQFSAGGLDFSSTSYDWLVVGGAQAQFKGAGTVNGVAGYQFLITAIDGNVSGGVDKFRIKIWNADGVIYDNQRGSGDDSSATTALSGGSIVIHK